MRFIVRVDDVGQAEDQTRSDEGMELFSRWYEPWKGLPLYCGIVPAFLNRSEHYWVDANIPAEFQAIHGWAHENVVLGDKELAMAVSWLKQSRAVIPPYNRYDEATLEACAKYIGPSAVLFGGFPNEHHPYGREPRIIRKCLHLSAERELYSRCYALADLLEVLKSPHRLIKAYSFEGIEWPLQVVLHHRWDLQNMDGVKRLRDVIANRMVRVDEAREWAMEMLDRRLEEGEA